MHARAGRTGGFTRALPIMIGMASALAACTKRAGSEAVTAGQYAQIEQADLPTEALSDWTTLYGAATLAELEREREGLLAYFLERSKPAFAARFASGDSVLVPGANRYYLDQSARLEVSAVSIAGTDAGGAVRKVVLSPKDYPELYVIKSKLNWLEPRISQLKSEAVWKEAIEQRPVSK